jgi:hypothetical protein
MASEWSARGLRLPLPSVVLDDGRSQGREFLEGLKTLLSRMAGFFHAAEWQLDPAAGSVSVDENLACFHLPRHVNSARGTESIAPTLVDMDSGFLASLGAAMTQSSRSQSPLSSSQSSVA